MTYLHRLARAGHVINLGALADGNLYAAIDTPDYAHTEPRPTWGEALKALNELCEREMGEAALTKETE